MKPDRHNPYGYKVCYRERRSKRIVRYFIVRSYKDAVSMKQLYIRYPPRERETDRQLNKPIWLILPITRKEVLRGIWRECPF